MGNLDIRKACYKGTFSDDIPLYFGDSDDVSVQWDGTNMILTAAADDSLIEIGDSGSTQCSFDVKIYGNGASGVDYLYWDASANKLSFVGAAIMEMGTSSAKVTDDTAGRRFISLYTDCGATSGDSYGIRAAHYITGAGGGGAAMRPYAIVQGVAASNVYGVEATAELSTTASSSITGELCAVKARVNINQTTSGTVNVLNLLISTAASKTMHANSAFIGVANEGDGTDIRNLFYFGDARGGAGAATIVNTDHANDIVTGANLYVKCADPTGDFWLLATTTAPASS